MNIIARAVEVEAATRAFVDHVRRFYYAVVLLGHRCPQCGGRPDVIAEGRCVCPACLFIFDPTLAFQECPSCGGNLKLRMRRYQCQRCGADVASRFLFDGIVFDREYFRKRMVEHRDRKRELKDRVREMLAGTRSRELETGAAGELDAVPGLLDALNGLTAALPAGFTHQLRAGFDLKRYQAHLQAHIEDFPVRLDDLPSLNADLRKDRIWRFIALIFMAHAGKIELWQEGEAIMVMRHETD